MNEPYIVLLAPSAAECELKKSRFIAHLQPVSSEAEAQDFVNSIKKQYYDARHNCYAYIIGKNADTVKYSDDGEPSQTAGLPMFNVLKESGIRNACVVVTRYFGGTLLGAGPLARMYADAVKLAVAEARIGVMQYGIEFRIETDYSDGEKIRRLVEKETGVELVDITYGAGQSFLLRTGFDEFERLSAAVTSLTAGRAQISKKKESYFLTEQ
ncbi:MAG: YigZ family protein [Lachnospiraceae bacterium]|nr:YigZ family protein [Lachnospiraceae bacterium]